MEIAQLWVSVTAGWLTGSSRAGAVSGLVRVRPILRGECPPTLAMPLLCALLNRRSKSEKKTQEMYM